mgnify:CR=1 FL=1
MYCQIIMQSPKRAMHKADGDQIENTTNTNQKQADKQNNQLRGGSECDGDENAC